MAKTREIVTPISHSTISSTGAAAKCSEAALNAKQVNSAIRFREKNDFEIRHMGTKVISIQDSKSFYVMNARVGFDYEQANAAHGSEIGPIKVPGTGYYLILPDFWVEVTYRYTKSSGQEEFTVSNVRQVFDIDVEFDVD